VFVKRFSSGVTLGISDQHSEEQDVAVRLAGGASAALFLVRKLRSAASGCLAAAFGYESRNSFIESSFAYDLCLK
jgi:hypothetical protein